MPTTSELAGKIEDILSNYAGSDFYEHIGIFDTEYILRLESEIKELKEKVKESQIWEAKVKQIEISLIHEQNQRKNFEEKIDKLFKENIRYKIEDFRKLANDAE